MKKLVVAFLLMVSFNSSAFALSQHTIKQGDILWNMAKTYFGDPTLWPAISDLNSVPNPNSIPIGTVLLIPSTSQAKQIVAETDSKKKAELIASIKGEPAPEENKEENKEEYNGDPENVTFEKRVLYKKIDRKKIKSASSDTGKEEEI